MSPLRLAVVIAPEDPLPGAELIRALRGLPTAHDLIYPISLESAVLAAALRKPPAPSAARERDAPALPRSLASGSWVEGSDAVLVPVLTPPLLATARFALDRGIPIFAGDEPYARRVLGIAAVYPGPPNHGEDWERSVRQLLDDPLAQQQYRRHVHTQLIRWNRATNGHPPAAARRSPEQSPTPTGPGVSVVIATTGGERVLRCIEALRSAAGDLDLQVIVAVTGGLRGALPPCDDVVRAEPPFCWARANNQALRHARHPLVLLLHDDCYFTRAGDLERLVRRLEICGHLVAVAPAGIGFPEHGEQSALRRGEGLRPTRFALSGACVLLRREAFVTTGSFDEGYVDYGCDDLDWFYRARAQGYRWAVDAEVRVEHEVAATFGDRSAAELHRSQARFRELHGAEPVDGSHWERPRLRLSWVIASRNGAGYLARCLGSIEASRSLFPEDMEVLLVLDGSTDRSADVAHSFNASLPIPLPLRLVRFPEPAGSAAKAKNRALRLALGEVHLPMDDDDAALPARAQLLPALESGCDVAVGDFWIVEPNGEVGVRQVAPTSFDRLSQPYAQNWGPWSTAIRAETWEQHGLFREDLPCDEDLDLWLRWLRDGVRFTHAPEPVHLYLIRPNSVVSRHNSVEIGERIRTAYRDDRGAPRMGLRGA